MQKTIKTLIFIAIAMVMSVFAQAETLSPQKGVVRIKLQSEVATFAPSEVILSFPREDAPELIDFLTNRVGAMLSEENSPRFEPVKQYWIRWGRQKLQHAKLFYAALPKTQPTHRAAVAWPVLWAADTLNKIAVEPALLDPGRRVKIPRARIYGTFCLTPLILLSNTLFNTWLQSKLNK